MVQYTDLYVLTNSRSFNLATKFVKRFLPKREETALDYPFPWLDDTPIRTFISADTLMRYMEKQYNKTYTTIYWASMDSKADIKHAMLFYTDDNEMLFRISMPSSLSESGDT